jgi:hypothetical protein
MKNTLKLIAFSLITFLIVSCSGSKGPEEAVKGYFDAVNAQDYEKAKEYATEESKGIIDLWKKIFPEKNEGAEKEIVKDLKCKIEGDTSAVCTYFNAKNKEQSVKVKKIADKWLIDLAKENLMRFNDASTQEAAIEKAISDSIATSKLLDSINQTK